MEKPFRMTQAQVSKAAQQSQYNLFQNSCGEFFGINSSIAPIVKRKKGYYPNQRTDWIGFIPCDFQTYISHKTPFL